METCDMPVGAESKRCGAVAVVAFVQAGSDAGQVGRAVHACVAHDGPVAFVLSANEGRPREARALGPLSDADVLRWALSGGGQ